MLFDSIDLLGLFGVYAGIIFLIGRRWPPKFHHPSWCQDEAWASCLAQHLALLEKSDELTEVEPGGVGQWSLAGGYMMMRGT